MSEQERQAPPRIDEGPGQAGEKPHERLPSLVTMAADETNPIEQARLVGEVNALLIAMRAPGDDADEARVLVAHLDAKMLNNLVDEQGRKAHTVAVETLLSLGFPHPLKVHPDDLKRFRDDEGSLGSEMLGVPRRYLFVSNVVLAVQAMGMSWALLAETRPLGWALTSFFGGAVGALALRVTKGIESNTWPTLLISAGAGAALLGGYAFRDPALLATGAATGLAVMAAHGRTAKPTK